MRLVEPYSYTKISALGIEEQRVHVLLDFTDPPEKWQAIGHGYRVNGKVITWKGDGVLTLPMGALFRDGAQWAVYTIEDHVAQLRHVRAGPSQRNAGRGGGRDQPGHRGDPASERPDLRRDPGTAAHVGRRRDAGVSRRGALGLLAAAPAALVLRPARAAEPVKIGLMLSMSGPFAQTGDIMSKAAELYLATEGRDVLGDVPVEIVLRDDGGPNPDTAKRLVQELVTRDRVQYIAGFQWTPNANAVAPLLNQAKMPCVLMNASGANTTRLSPYFIRTGFTQWQVNMPLGAVGGGEEGLAEGLRAGHRFRAWA